MINQSNAIHQPAGAGTVIQMGPDEALLFKAVGEQTAALFDVFEDTMAPKAGPPEHIHYQNDEAFYILEGDFLVRSVSTCSKPRQERFVMFREGQLIPGKMWGRKQAKCSSSVHLVEWMASFKH